MSAPETATNQSSPELHAVLWDFDGTLVDTEPLWKRAEIEFMARYGASWTIEEGQQLTGASWKHSTAVLRQAALRQGKQIDIDDYQMYKDLVAIVVDLASADHVPWLPGSQQLLQQCAAAGLRLGLVSASPAVLLNTVLSRIDEGFDVVVDGEQVENGKPAPDGYLMAMAKLGVTADSCIVLEDSKPGVAAGLASGAAVVALLTTGQHEPSDQMIIRPNLAGVSVEDLRRWHAELTSRKADDERRQ